MKYFTLGNITLKMGFTRDWDASCPRVWSTWKEDGKTWIIQDIPPEDDAEAVELMRVHHSGDEPLCKQNGIQKDPESIGGMTNIWLLCMSLRTSLGCYTEVDGKKTLVALNCCIVVGKDDEHKLEIKAEGWKRVYGAVHLMNTKGDAFGYLGVDQLLSAVGLVVKREFRGKRLGCKLLDAREPLCKALGIKATATVFTAPAAQRSAEKCGFTTILEMTWSDFADAGLDYPRENNICKLMVKKYE